MRPVLALAALACCRAGARGLEEGPLRDELALVQRRLGLIAAEQEGGGAGGNAVSGDQARQGGSALVNKKATQMPIIGGNIAGLLGKAIFGDKKVQKELERQVGLSMLSDRERALLDKAVIMFEKGNLSSINTTAKQLGKLITMSFDGRANQSKKALKGLSQWATGDDNPVKMFVEDVKTKRKNWMNEGFAKTRNYIGAALRNGVGDQYGAQLPPAPGSDYQPSVQQQGLPMQPQEWWQQAPQPWPPTQPGSFQPQAWQPQQIQMQQWQQQWPPQQWEPQQWQQMQPPQLQQMQPQQLQQMQQMQQMQPQQQMQQMQQMPPQQFQQMQPQMWQQVQPQMGQEMQPQQWQQLQQLPPAQQPAQPMQAAAQLQPQQQ